MLKDKVRSFRQRIALIRWKFGKRAMPLPVIEKQRVLHEHVTKYGLKTLIETGTYLGDTIASLMGRMDRLISIEISQPLAESAQRRFRNYPQITVIHGDSATVLPSILGGLIHPCLFWLDAHYSGGVTGRSEVDTPIEVELEVLFTAFPKGSVLLIDDARHFTGSHGYPRLEDLLERVRRSGKFSNVMVCDDIIRCVPIPI